MAGLKDCDGVRGVRESCSMGIVRGGGSGGGVCDRHEREVFGLNVRLRIVVIIVQGRHPRRGLGCARFGNVNNESLIDCLAAGVV